ncbi:MAG: DUF4153 domain-containing protein [Bacteroidales bacterium]|nr:DUF4153 domain-containing protein [Bacteroidales bacterium]
MAMIFTLFLTCFLIFLSHDGAEDEKRKFFYIFYPATGSLLAVALSLLTEDFKKKILAVVFQVVVHAIWLGVSIYLAQFDRFSVPQIIAVSATVFAIGLSIFLICFYRKSHELPFWNFSMRTVVSLVVAIAIGGVLTLGLFALIESLKMLFDMKINDRVFPDIAAVCMVALAPTLFMNLIPRGDDKYLFTAPEFSRFAKGVVQYLFLPLLGLYLITLYAYAAKILLEWSLPVGGVSYLVSGSMVLMVLLIYVTYPIQYQEGSKLFKNVTRWLPVLMLPLLALMTVAIGRRLADYGITVSRLYLLVFNLWCYAVCLWLIFTRNKRIWLIPASFAVILFLISVGPQSIANVTQRQLKKEASMAFNASGIRQFPLSGEQYEQWLKGADPKVAAAIDSKLHYLKRDYGYNAIDDLVGKDVIIGRYSALDENGNIVEEMQDTYRNSDLIEGVMVPEGYTSMTMVSGSDGNIVKVEGDKMWIKFEDGNHVEHQFEIDVKRLAEFDAEKNPDGPLAFENGDALLMINDFYITVYSKGTNYLLCSGIMFTK